MPVLMPDPRARTPVTAFSQLRKAGTDLALLELAGLLDDCLDVLRAHGRAHRGKAVFLGGLPLGSQVLVGQHLHRHPVLVVQEVTPDQGPKDVLA